MRPCTARRPARALAPRSGSGPELRMKIVKLEDFHADGGWRTLSFLKLVTDDGLVGWSEFNEGFGVGGVSDIIRRFAPMVAGMDPRAVGRIGASLRALT